MDKQEKRNQLARDVLLLSRNTLLVNLRFLDMALSRLELFASDNGTLQCDGEYLVYNPTHVLQCYKNGKEIPVRDYLHIVMHCVFRHMFMDPTLNRVYWDLACDIAVEHDLKHVTAEKIYSYLRQTMPDPAKIAEIRGLFYADNHEVWYMTGEEKAAAYGLTPPQRGNGEGEGEGEGKGKGTSSIRAAVAADWQRVAERMQVDLETFGKQRGLNPGAMTQNLQAVTREKYDYTVSARRYLTRDRRC